MNSPHLKTLAEPHNLLIYLTYDATEIVKRKGDDEHIHMIEQVHKDFEASLRSQGFYNVLIRPKRLGTYLRLNTSKITLEQLVRIIQDQIPHSDRTKAPDRGFATNPKDTAHIK